MFFEDSDLFYSSDDSQRHGKCFVHEYTVNVRKNVNGRNGQARFGGVSLSVQLRRPIKGRGQVLKVVSCQE